MSYLREIWQFKPKRLLHQGIVNGSIAKKKFIFYSSYFTRNFSLIPLIFSVLFSLFLLCSPSALSSLKLHHRNFSPISHSSLSSLISRPLSHCTDAGFWIFEVGGWISGIGELGLDRWAGIGLSVGLKWWICWSVGGSFRLIIGSFGDDFWVFSTAWVSNRWRGFVDRWLYWWFVFVCVALLWLGCGWTGWFF